MGLPDFMQWRCTGCGKIAKGNTKPCDCATGVGYRKGPNDKMEHTVFEVDRVGQWDEWYSRLPAELKQRLSFHDFKRLGHLFKDVFEIS